MRASIVGAALALACASGAPIFIDEDPTTWVSKVSVEPSEDDGKSPGLVAIEDSLAVATSLRLAEQGLQGGKGGNWVSIRIDSLTRAPNDLADHWVADATVEVLKPRWPQGPRVRWRFRLSVTSSFEDVPAF